MTRCTKRNTGAADTAALFCFACKAIKSMASRGPVSGTMQQFCTRFTNKMVLRVVLKCGRNTSLLRNWSCVWF